jgi:hypothetical protein
MRILKPGTPPPPEPPEPSPVMQCQDCLSIVELEPEDISIQFVVRGPDVLRGFYCPVCRTGRWFLDVRKYGPETETGREVAAERANA